jgi:hypothetical protein
MDDRVVFPTLELRPPVRGLCSLAHVESHAQTFVRHGSDLSQPQRDARHVTSGFSPLLFYLSERGHSGPKSFSFSRKLYRKKPGKLRRMQQKEAGATLGNGNAESSGPVTSQLRFL